MNKEQICALGLIESPERKPHFKGELQQREYEQALIDVHKSDDRRNLIHSKKGLQIVLLYMQVWQIPAHQAMRELINDDAYTCFICP
jgi:hypothetical protein